VLEFLSFTSYSHFFFVVKLAYTTILQRTHQQPSRDDMVQFYCEHHNLDHGDFCSENYNIAGTPNLNSKSNSNSNLKVAVNLYVFVLLFFFSGWKLQRCLGSNCTTICPRVPSSRTLRLGQKNAQKRQNNAQKRGQGRARISQEEPGVARRSRAEPGEAGRSHEVPGVIPPGFSWLLPAPLLSLAPPGSSRLLLAPLGPSWPLFGPSCLLPPAT